MNKNLEITHRQKVIDLTIADADKFSKILKRTLYVVDVDGQILAAWARVGTVLYEAVYREN